MYKFFVKIKLNIVFFIQKNIRNGKGNEQYIFKMGWWKEMVC